MAETQAKNIYKQHVRNQNRRLISTEDGSRFETRYFPTWQVAQAAITLPHNEAMF